MHAQLKEAKERLEKATSQCLRSFEKLRDTQADVCNSLKSHSSAKMAAVQACEAPTKAPEPPETLAEAASENGAALGAGHEDVRQEEYFDEDTQLTITVEELPPEKLTETKLLEKKRKNPKISGSGQTDLAASCC